MYYLNVRLSKAILLVLLLLHVMCSLNAMERPRRPVPSMGIVAGTTSNWGLRIQAMMIVFMLGGVSPYFASAKFFPLNGAPCRVPETTLWGWLDHFYWWGEPPEQTKRFRRYSRGGTKKMSTLQLAYLKDMLKHQPYLYLDQITEYMFYKFNIKWSHTCVYTAITVKLNLSLQQITMRALQASELERFVYLNALSSFDDPAMFVFVDETMVGKNESRRTRNWAPVGEGAPIGWEIFQADEYDQEIYSMLAAADINGFLGPGVCQPVWRAAGKDDRNVLRGTINGADFETWLEKTLIPTLGLVALNQPRSVVVMDNASVHNHGRIEAMINKAGATVVWNAAYSPDLNPIERCFHQYKSELKRSRLTHPDAIDRHMAALYSVKRENMINYYGGKALNGAIRNLPRAKKEMSVQKWLVQKGAGLALLGGGLLK